MRLMMIELEMQNVVLGYNRHPILENLNIKVSPGELVGLIGPNGCGKSTIIKAFSHIINPLSGTILIDQRPIAGIPRRELSRLVGVVPQIPLLPSTFSALEIVLMGRNPHLGLFQSEGPRDWDLARQAMEQTATAALADRRINELSGGEIQCILIARALVQETRAILLDEPTANLDIGRQVEILDLMKKLCRENNLTILAALHDLNLAAQYCHRLVLLHQGRIHAEGKPTEVITDEHIRQVYGAENCDISWPANTDALCAVEGSTVPLSAADRATSDGTYDLIALAIAAYEDSTEVNAFTSKWDLSRGDGGDGMLTKLEQRGFALFQGKGQCKRCHVTSGKNALFTDFTFDNLGVPKNPDNPVYNVDPDFVDAGLGGFLMNAGYEEDVYMAEWGKHKVPTLRNVDLRTSPDFIKAYAHNGYFKTLEGIVHFYNTRDVKPECPGDYTEAEALAAGCWPAPEVAENVNTDELGDLGLTPEEEAAIVAFMETLSDGFEP